MPLPNCRTHVVLQKCTHSLSLLNSMTHENTLNLAHQNDYHLCGWWIYKSWRSSLFSCLQSPLISSHLSPNIFLSILLSNTHTLCFSLNVWDQVSHSYKTTGNVTVVCVSVLNILGCDVMWCDGCDGKHFRHLVLTAEGHTHKDGYRNKPPRTVSSYLVIKVQGRLKILRR